ncbi:MAG: LysM peptidoglycan-binding domain-containing protein [Gammaproteobacteria bacterium]|nr:LysM peptidoglycan-binding domain-containing protein [Gammaproteobacteria bacterium]
MKILNISVSVLLMLSSINTKAELQGKYWLVNSGDTLYGIARSVFPKDAMLQAKLRTQIITLNQNIFMSGSGSLNIGARLTLPAFAYTQSAHALKKTATQPSLKTKSSANLLSEHQWQIKPGDTLYSIARAYFPASNKKQSILRKDIVRINPQVFSNGANKMEVGVFLRLPEYLIKPENSASRVSVPAVKQKPQAIISNENTDNHIKIIENKIEPVTETDKTVSELPVDKKEESNRVINDRADHVTSQISFSVGYSTGGDVAVPTQGGHEITYGSGAHLRFLYDQFWSDKNGYRLALGYQLDRVTAGNDSGQLDQTYLQALYVYNTTASLFAVGASYHDNISRTTDISGTQSVEDYEPAMGLVMMYEIKHLFGDNIVGLAYTQLETEHSISQVKEDMSRTEIYYRWQF